MGTGVFFQATNRAAGNACALSLIQAGGHLWLRHAIKEIMGVNIIATRPPLSAPLSGPKHFLFRD